MHSTESQIQHLRGTELDLCSSSGSCQASVWFICISAADDPSVSQPVFTITEKVPTRAFSWLKAATSAFTPKTLHYKDTMLNGSQPTVSRCEIGMPAQR